MAVQQQQYIKQLRKQKEHIKGNHSQALNQVSMFKDLQKLLELKMKYVNQGDASDNHYRQDVNRLVVRE